MTTDKGRYLRKWEGLRLRLCCLCSSSSSKHNHKRKSNTSFSCGCASSHEEIVSHELKDELTRTLGPSESRINSQQLGKKEAAALAALRKKRAGSHPCTVILANGELCGHHYFVNLLKANEHMQDKHKLLDTDGLLYEDVRALNATHPCPILLKNGKKCRQKYYNTAHHANSHMRKEHGLGALDPHMYAKEEKGLKAKKKTRARKKTTSTTSAPMNTNSISLSTVRHFSIHIY